MEKLREQSLCFGTMIITETVSTRSTSLNVPSNTGENCRKMKSLRHVMRLLLRQVPVRKEWAYLARRPIGRVGLVRVRYMMGVPIFRFVS
jgi:hypothetical protein